MAELKQSTARNRLFKMISSTDHLSLKTGASPVVNISKNGAAFGAAAGAVTEIANGWYQVALTSADTGTLGDLAYYITGTGADDTDFCDQVVGNILGDTLPANVTQWSSGAVPAPNVTGVPLVDLKYTLGTISPAAAGSVSVDWAQVKNPTTTLDLSNTTIKNLDNNPPGTLTAAQIATGVWQDATAGDFTVASSIGKTLYIANVAPGGSGGLLISGSNAGTTTLGALTVTGATTLTGAVAANGGVTFTSSTGDGFVCSSTGGNGNGINASGNGTGDGIKGTGGATGRGLHGIGGATSGEGARFEAQGGGSQGMKCLGNGGGAGIEGDGGSGTANGILGVGGAVGGPGIQGSGQTNDAGIAAIGQGTGQGLYAQGGATGQGFFVGGGATSGSAMRISAPNGNALDISSTTGGHAMALTAQGGGGVGLRIRANTTGAGIDVQGGTTGAGIKIQGGATSGDGIDILTTSGDGLSILPTAGNGITATANGTSKHGIVSTGGTAGTSDGVKCVAGTGGVDLRANITGNITGTLATVTTLTNLPSIPANWLTASGINAGALNGKGDWYIVGTALTEGYTTGAFTIDQALYEIAQKVGQFSISGTTITFQKRDKTTTAGTDTIDSSTNPTLRTRAT